MNANELMIGDWVRITDDDGCMTNSFSGMIEAIDELWNVYVKAPGDETAYHYSADCAEPIPLTPEILEKNGFVNKNGRFMQKGNFDDPPLIMWHLVDDKTLRHPKSQLEIHHGAKSMHVSLVCTNVHQLQHALRLCGIEKEITL